MSLIQKQNQDAFAVLVHRYSDRFYRLAYRTLFNQADSEDVVQDCFIKIWQKPGLWNAKAGAVFSTWFYRMIVNACIDKNRGIKPGESSDDVMLLDHEANSQDILIACEQDTNQQKLLRQAIQALPKRQQMAVNLCFYEGLSNQQAADILGVKLKALQSLLMRAKSGLKLALSSQEVN